MEYTKENKGKISNSKTDLQLIVGLRQFNWSFLEILTNTRSFRNGDHGWTETNPEKNPYEDWLPKSWNCSSRNPFYFDGLFSDILEMKGLYTEIPISLSGKNNEQLKIVAAALFSSDQIIIGKSK